MKNLAICLVGIPLALSGCLLVWAVGWNDERKARRRWT